MSIPCPIPKEAARAMFDQIEYRLPINGTCKDGDHSLHITDDWIEFSPFIKRKKLILSWLEDSGGLCDCTVISVAEKNWRNE